MGVEGKNTIYNETLVPQFSPSQFLLVACLLCFVGRLLACHHGWWRETKRAGIRESPLPSHYSCTLLHPVRFQYVQFLYHCAGAILALATLYQDANTKRAAGKNLARESVIRREFHFFAVTLVFPIAMVRDLSYLAMIPGIQGGTCAFRLFACSSGGYTSSVPIL